MSTAVPEDLQEMARRALPNVVKVISMIAQGQRPTGSYRLRCGHILGAARFLKELASETGDLSGLSEADLRRLEAVQNRYLLGEEEKDWLDRFTDSVRREVPELSDLCQIMLLGRREYENLDAKGRAAVRCSLSLVEKLKLGEVPACWLDTDLDGRIDLVCDVAKKLKNDHQDSP